MSAKSLRNKRRKEISLRDSLRVCISKNDILIEDFYGYPNNPYAVYDYEGNLLETNSDTNLFTYQVITRLPHWRVVRKMWWGIE
jgi:hypothetical protein